MPITPTVPRRGARTALLLGVAALTLTGCADTVRDGSTAAPDQSTTQAAPADQAPSPTETESTAAGGVQITGDYQADLAAVGFEPTAEDFEVVMAQHEENLCEEEMDPYGIVDRFKRNVTMTAENDTAGPDMVRVVVEYNCPQRAQAVENIIAGNDYW